jgi:hypothetical protein
VSLCFLTYLAVILTAQTPSYDLILRNGRIVDGGSPQVTMVSAKAFDEAASKWRQHTAKFVRSLLTQASSHSWNVESGTIDLLREETKLASKTPPSGTGGWGIVANAKNPLVVMIQQNLFKMKIFPDFE